jgi:hypothetical protein
VIVPVNFLFSYILDNTTFRDTTLASQLADHLPRSCKPSSPSSHRSNRSIWCFPLHHLRSVRVCQKSKFHFGPTCTACAEDSGVPNTCQHCIGATEFDKAHHSSGSSSSSALPSGLQSLSALDILRQFVSVLSVGKEKDCASTRTGRRPNARDTRHLVQQCPANASTFWSMPEPAQLPLLFGTQFGPFAVC